MWRGRSFRGRNRGRLGTKTAFTIGLSLLAFGSASDAQVRVRGYTRSDGSYVMPHYRSSPDGSRLNNWSTQGNYNPYTGRQGTQPLYGGSNYGRSSAFGSFGRYSGSSSRSNSSSLFGGDDD